MENSSKVLVFTPTFNEKTNIGIWLNEAPEKFKDSNLLVADDSPVDGTLETLQEWASSNLHLFIHVRSSKSGVKSAHAWEINYAFDSGHDHLIAKDVDLSHNPEDKPRLLRAGQAANYVVATRNRRKGRVNERPGLGKLWSLRAKVLCRIMIPKGLSEYTTSFRCYDRKAMAALLSNPSKNERYSFSLRLLN